MCYSRPLVGRCDDPNDWLRREIEAALDSHRNAVPLMLEGFDLGTPKIAGHLTGKLAALRHYNGLTIPPEYFLEAMGRLRDKYLNVPLTAVLHPASLAAQQSATEQKAAAEAAPAVKKEELTARQWVERGLATIHIDEKFRLFTEAIQLDPEYATAFYFRGSARKAKGDLDGALRDYDEAIRLQPHDAINFRARGRTRERIGDIEGANRDFSRAAHLESGFSPQLSKPPLL